MIAWKPIGTFDYGYRAVLLWLPSAHRGTPSAEVAWWCGDKGRWLLVDERQFERWCRHARMVGSDALGGNKSTRGRSTWPTMICR